jgi:hypothetical protein
MTIILSTRRDSFAVLAADQLHGRAGGDALDFQPKVVLHPSLPLAFAIGGLMRFAVRAQYAWATDHVARFARTITSPAQLVLQDIAEQLRVLFQPAMDLERDRMQIFIALMSDGKADVGVQRVTAASIDDDPTRFIPGCRHYIMPEGLWTFYDQGNRLEVMHDPAVTDPRDVYRFARELIQAGINCEASWHADGKNRVIGGDIDIVLVSSAGASPLDVA